MRDSATQSRSLAVPIRRTLEHSSSPGLLGLPGLPGSVCLPDYLPNPGPPPLPRLPGPVSSRVPRSRKGTDAAPTSSQLAALPSLPYPALLDLTSSWLRWSNFPDAPRRSRGCQKECPSHFHSRQTVLTDRQTSPVNHFGHFGKFDIWQLASGSGQSTAGPEKKRKATPGANKQHPSPTPNKSIRILPCSRDQHPRSQLESCAAD